MGDAVDEPLGDKSPSKARFKLTEDVVALQRKVSSLLVLRGGDVRRTQLLDDIRSELQERQDDLRVLDSIYDTSVRVALHPNVAGLGAQPQDVGNSSHHFARLPSDLPKFLGSGSNTAAFIESLDFP